MSVVFFTDRNLGKQFPRILKDAGIAVEHHFDHFPDTTKDEEWLAAIGQQGWYALTHDQRIRYKPNEQTAVMQAGVGLFVLVGKAPFSELATNFVATLPKIERFIQQTPRPFIARIYRPGEKTRKLHPDSSGRVEIWIP